ncbi:MAG: 4Fe-4S binding protein [Adlercreutzia sp.]|nr:4Fe-4S binding protein [Adlercreutzia sp.]
MDAISSPRRPFTPFLRDGLSTPPEEYARSTCYTAGFLTSVNAGWRSEKPLIDPVQCTLCLNCYMYCPDGTVFKVRDEEGVLTAVAIDYDFCKGCGVCAKVCPADCIAMVDERVAENEGAPVDTETVAGLPSIDGPVGEVA